MKFFLSFNIVLLFVFSSCQKHYEPSYNEKQIDSVFTHIKNEKNLLKQIKEYKSLLNHNYTNEDLKAKINFELGNANYNLLKYDKAILHYKRAWSQANDELLKGKTAVNLSYVYVDKGQKDKAMEYAHIAMNMADNNKNSKLKYLALQALSKIYFFYDDFIKSEEMIQKAMKIQKQNNDSVGLATSYSNLGIIYFHHKKYKDAYDSTLKSLILNKKLKDDIGIATSYNNLGGYATMMNMNSDSIISWYNKAIEIKKKKGIPYIDELINIAFVYTKDNKFDKSKKLLHTALVLSNDVGQKKTVYDHYLELALKEKDIDRIDKYIIKRDSLISEIQKIKNKEKVRLLEQNYKLNLQKAQLENKEVKLKKNIFLYTSLILILILSIIIASLAYVNKNLKFKQEKMRLQQMLFNAQLNPHFIFNSLTALQNSLIRETPLRAITYLSRFAKLIRKNFDMVSKEAVSLREELSLLEDFVAMQKIRDIHDFDFQIQLAEEIQPPSLIVPPLLLQPLIENAIEHGFSKMNKKGKISLKIYEKENKICFEVTDNGTGFNENNQNRDGRIHALEILKERLKLFNKDKKTYFKITNLHPGTSVSFCIDKKEIK